MEREPGGLRRQRPFPSEGWHIDIKSASFTGAPLPKTENMLIDEDDLEDEEELCAYVDENGVRCRNHARPDSCFCGIHDGLDEE